MQEKPFRKRATEYEAEASVHLADLMTKAAAANLAHEDVAAIEEIPAVGRSHLTAPADLQNMENAGGSKTPIIGEVGFVSMPAGLAHPNQVEEKTDGAVDCVSLLNRMAYVERTGDCETTSVGLDRLRDRGSTQ